jgi:hypothetical protein
MWQLHWVAGLVAPILFTRTIAFTQPCIYQAEKCGFTMISAYGIPSLNKPVLDKQIMTLARL